MLKNLLENAKLRLEYALHLSSYPIYQQPMHYQFELTNLLKSNHNSLELTYFSLESTISIPEVEFRRSPELSILGPNCGYSVQTQGNWRFLKRLEMVGENT